MLSAELESLAHAPLTDAGAVSVLRWHALSGYSLRLDPVHGRAGDDRRAAPARCWRRSPARRRSSAGSTRRWRRSPIATAASRCSTRDGGDGSARGRRWWRFRSTRSGRSSSTPALAEDKRAAIALGQASRGIKIMIRARGEPVHAERDPPRAPVRLPGHRGAVRRRHAADDRVRARRRALRRRPTWRRVQRQLDAILPGYELLDATAHDWLADEFSRGHLGDPPARLVRAPSRRDAARRRPGGAGRLGPGRRLGRVHRRGDRVRPARRDGGRRRSAR